MMSLIDNLNEILNFSLPFPFYQQFNPLFNGISTHLVINWKCFDQLIKGADIPLNNGLNC